MVKLLYRSAFINLFLMLISTTGNGQGVSINSYPVKGFPLHKNKQEWSFKYENKFNKKPEKVLHLLGLKAHGWKQHPKYKHIRGYNGDITLKISAPGPITKLSTKAKVVNYADGKKRMAVISYSVNGVDYKTIAEKEFGSINISGTIKPVKNQGILWLRFRRIIKKGDSNGTSGYVVFRSIGFDITGTLPVVNKDTDSVTVVQKKNSEIVLVASNKVPLTIVIPNKAMALEHISGTGRSKEINQRSAAFILQTYLERVSGARIPIVTVRDTPKSGNIILVGDSKLTRKHGIVAPAINNGFRIKSFPGGIGIVGNILTKKRSGFKNDVDTGILAGVYEFLERYVGFLFILDDNDSRKNKLEEALCTVFPTKGPVIIPREINLQMAPVFPQRICHGVRESVFRAGTANGFYANHSHGNKAWARRYMKTNPDFFLTNADGTKNEKFLCYTNPEVLKKDLEHIEDFYNGRGWKGGGYSPRGNFILYEPEDNQPVCYCKRCQKLTQKKKGRFGKLSNLHWDYANRLAREIAKRWPGKRLATLAYQGHTDPPDFKLEDNIDVMVCMMPFSSVMGRFPHAYKESMRRLKTWSKRLNNDRKRLYIFDYYCWPAFWTAAPLIYPHCLQKFLQESQSILAGGLICSGGNTPQAAHLMHLLTSRLMWNPETNIDAFIEKYCKLYFGPAAEPMQRFYKICMMRFEKAVSKSKPGDSYIEPKIMYGEIFPAETINNMERALGDARKTVQNLAPENPYQKRVLWMIDGFSHYRPTNGMYETQYGFFTEARQAHKWLGEKPKYTIKRTALPPLGFNDSVWEKVDALYLVHGAEIPKYSLENFGFAADVKTGIKMLYDDDNIYCLMNIEEPLMRDAIVADRKNQERELEIHLGGTKKVKLQGDSVKIELFPNTNKKNIFSMSCNLSGKVLDSTIKKVNVKARQRTNTYELFVTIPRKELACLSNQMLAQFYRTRAPRDKNSVERHYIWSPKLGAPWGKFPQYRYGKVILK